MTKLDIIQEYKDATKGVKAWKIKNIEDIIESGDSALALVQSHFRTGYQDDGSYSISPHRVNLSAGSLSIDYFLKYEGMIIRSQLLGLYAREKCLSKSSNFIFDNKILNQYEEFLTQVYFDMCKNNAISKFDKMFKSFPFPNLPPSRCSPSTPSTPEFRLFKYSKFFLLSESQSKVKVAKAKKSVLNKKRKQIEDGLKILPDNTELNKQLAKTNEQIFNCASLSSKFYSKLRLRGEHTKKNTLWIIDAGKYITSFFPKLINGLDDAKLMANLSSLHKCSNQDIIERNNNGKFFLW